MATIQPANQNTTCIPGVLALAGGPYKHIESGELLPIRIHLRQWPVAREPPRPFRLGRRCSKTMYNSHPQCNRSLVFAATMTPLTRHVTIVSKRRSQKPPAGVQRFRRTLELEVVQRRGRLRLENRFHIAPAEGIEGLPGTNVRGNAARHKGCLPHSEKKAWLTRLALR